MGQKQTPQRDIDRRILSDLCDRLGCISNEKCYGTLAWCLGAKQHATRKELDAWDREFERP